jgi:hypothetical protein
MGRVSARRRSVRGSGKVIMVVADKFLLYQGGRSAY